MDRHHWLLPSLVAVAISLTMFACRTTAPAPQFCGLVRGMTQAEFLDGAPAKCSLRSYDLYTEDSGGWVPVAPGGPDPQPMNVSGSVAARVPMRSIRVGGDVWDVWTYSVYSRTALGTRYDHREYAVFNDHRLVGWGFGQPPHELLDHPEEIARWSDD